MAYNGSGTFLLYQPGNPVVTGTTISSSWANNTLSDLATGLSTAVTKDGQTVATARVPFAQGINVGVSAILPNGSVGAPGEQFAASTSAGRWSISATRIGESIAGVQVGEWSDVGLKANISAYTARDATASIATATPTTIFSAATLSGLAIVTAYIPSTASTRTASAMITGDGAGGVRILANDGANLTITLSGTNVQVTQTTGGNAAVAFAYLNIK